MREVIASMQTSKDKTIEEQYALKKLHNKEREYEILQHEFLSSLVKTTVNLNEIRQKISALE